MQIQNITFGACQSQGEPGKYLPRFGFELPGNDLRFPAYLCAAEAYAPPGEAPAMARNFVGGFDRTTL